MARPWTEPLKPRTRLKSTELESKCLAVEDIILRNLEPLVERLTLLPSIRQIQ